MAKLLILDLDGTVCPAFKGNAYPAVIRWLAEHKGEYEHFAVATNQGGVGMHHWMSSDGFGNPTSYPTEMDVRNRIAAVVRALGIPARVYIAFAYRAKSGQWSPTPPGKSLDPEWDHEYRKPSAGMLIAAYLDAGVAPDEALMVGDRDEDEEAARRAGVAYMHPRDFFGEGYDQP